MSATAQRAQTAHRLSEGIILRPDESAPPLKSVAPDTPIGRVTVAVPIEVAHTLPERVQRQLGYHWYHPSAYGGRLGLVDFEDARRLL